MIRFFLRAFSILPFILGVVTLVGDTTRSVFEERPFLLSFGDFLAVNLPNVLFNIKGWFDSNLPTNGWYAFEQLLLNLPGTPLFLGLATMLYFFGRQKPSRKSIGS